MKAVIRKGNLNYTEKTQDQAPDRMSDRLFPIGHSRANLYK